jgi:hypothetical protein
VAQLIHTLQRCAAEGSISRSQAVTALRLRLEMLANAPLKMLQHVLLGIEVLRIFPLGAEDDEQEFDVCEFFFAASETLEAWGQYGGAREAVHALESRACPGTAARARFISERIFFGETGAVGQGVATDATAWTSPAGRYTRAYFMWASGAAAAVHCNRQALLAVEDPQVELCLPLIVAACCANVGNGGAALAALEMFDDRRSQRTATTDPALVALFHALRGRVQLEDDPALAEADFRAAQSLVAAVPDSLPWAYYLLLHAEALLGSDLETSDRLIALLEASPVKRNFVVRGLLSGINVARALASGQHDALQLAVQRHAETHEVLHSLAASPEEFASVLRYWQERWVVAVGAEALANQRHSSALLDRFLIVSAGGLSRNSTRILRNVGAAHCIARALGWSDAELRYLRSFILFGALSLEDKSFISLPPFPVLRHDQLEGVVAAAEFVAQKLDGNRASLVASLRLAAEGAPAKYRPALNAVAALVAMQDFRRIVEFEVQELGKCNLLQSA